MRRKEREKTEEDSWRSVRERWSSSRGEAAQRKMDEFVWETGNEKEENTQEEGGRDGEIASNECQCWSRFLPGITFS